MFDYALLMGQHIVGNKAKGRISKLVLQENKARQIFRETNFCYPLLRTRTYGLVNMDSVAFYQTMA